MTKDFEGKKELANIYDGESSTYDKTRYVENKYRKYITLVKENLISKFLKGGSILELGIGTGRFAIPLSAKYRYIGIDISKGMLSVAKKKLENNKNVNLILMDAEKLGFKNESFDNIICVHTFKFFPDPIRVLGECYRVLRGEGRVIIITESRERLLQPLTFKNGRVKKREGKHFWKLYNLHELKSLITAIGFKIIYSQSLFLFPITVYKLMPGKLLYYLGKVDRSSMDIGKNVLIVAEKNSQGR